MGTTSGNPKVAEPVEIIFDPTRRAARTHGFRRAAQLDLSVFLINDRVTKKKAGRDLPADIFSFALPLTRNEADREAGGEGVKSVLDRSRIGIELRNVEALFGAALVPYSFKGRPAEYRIYETGPGRPVGCFTFVDGVLVEFAGWGRLPVDQILRGGGAASIRRKLASETLSASSATPYDQPNLTL